MLRWFIFGYCCMISIIMSWCLFLRSCRIVRHNCINLCETSKNWFWAITLMVCAGFWSSIRVIEARKWLSFHLGQAKLNHLLLQCILYALWIFARIFLCAFSIPLPISAFDCCFLYLSVPFCMMCWYVIWSTPKLSLYAVCRFFQFPTCISWHAKWTCTFCRVTFCFV